MVRSWASADAEEAREAEDAEEDLERVVRELEAGRGEAEAVVVAGAAARGGAPVEAA